MKKILFFIPGLSGGGAEKVLRNLVNNMDQSRFEITVQTIDKEDPTEYLAEGIRYKSVNPFKKGILKKLYDYWFRICAELKIAYPLMVKDDYDIEVAYLECGATKVIAQSTNKEAKKIAWVHCDLEKKEGIADNLTKTAEYYQKFDQVICVSEDVKKSFRNLFPDVKNVRVLHNVIDEDEIKTKADKGADALIESEQEAFKFVTAGRLTRQKGFDILLDACNILKHGSCNFHLTIMGEGEERSMLEDKIKQNDLEKYVTLTGFCSNPYSTIKRGDAYVCSSRYEGISTAVTEALILGKPVVTAECTGMREILGNSEYGLIVDANAAALSDGMKYLMESNQILKNYQGKSYLRGKEFYKSAIIKQTQELFEEL